MNKSIIILSLALLFPLSAHALVIDLGSKTQADIDAEAKASADAEILMQTNEESDGAMSATTSGSVKTAFDVKNDADLAAFIETNIATHSRVKQVAIDEEGEASFVVEYDHPVRLFGLFPISITSKTSVSADAEGNADAKTTFPWWSLFVTGLADASADIESAIEGSSTVQSAIEADASLSAKAQATEAIVLTLSAYSHVSLVGDAQ